jgi:signal transduction histidine kinase
MNSESRFRPGSRSLVLVPFVVIAALFACADALAVHRLSVGRAETETIMRDALTSIELVSKMQRDIAEVRVVTDEHILEHRTESMAALDAQMMALWGDYATAAKAYEPLGAQSDDPDEQQVWTEAKAEVEDLRPGLEATLAISRQNLDAEARRSAELLQGSFDRVLHTFMSLTDIARGTAGEALARAEARHRAGVVLLIVLSGVGMILSLVVGETTTRVVQRREELQHRYARVLAQMNSELDAFAGRVAHDLRNPLSTAKLATTRLMHQAPEQYKATEAIQRSLARMEALIDDMLELSRMRATAQASQCDPAAVAAQLGDELAPRAASLDASLAIDVQHATVRCREGLLRQVLWNLVDNAMKYRRKEVHPSVEISGHPVNHGYDLEVRDNGIGMSPEDASRVFDPLFRASRSKGEPGTGIGLSIVRRVVEASGGTLSVSSKLGAGSTFVVHLPRG